MIASAFRIRTCFLSTKVKNILSARIYQSTVQSNTADHGIINASLFSFSNLGFQSYFDPMGMEDRPYLLPPLSGCR